MKRTTGYGPSIIVLVTAIVVLLAGPAAVRKITYAHTKSQIIEAGQRLAQNPVLEQINQAYRDIATLVEPSVVHISTEHVFQDRWGNQARKASSGSGWIFDEQGHIVTNEHVIEGAFRIEVQLYNGVIREAEIVGTDPSTDIAVLKIDPGELHPATRYEPAEGMVRQGDLVFAFGSPFDFRFSMSKGVVSGKGRSVGVIRDERGRPFGYENFIQVDAAINPGNSGGPLTDYRGHVIGMNTAIATGKRNSANFDDGQFAGIGLAIPVEMIEPVVSQLIENGVVAKGYLGLSVVDRSKLVGEELDVLEFNGYGLMVGRIDPGQPALAAGLRPGDVITHLERQHVATVRQFVSMTSSLSTEDEVFVQVWRFDDELDRGRTQRIHLPGVALKGLRGLALLQVDDSIAQALDALGFAGRGVRVARLVPDGPARRSGLRRGDVITQVNGAPVGTVQQLRSTISSMLPGQTVRLAVWRYDAETDTSERLEIPVDLARLNPMQVSGSLPPDQSRSRIPVVGIERMSTATEALAEELGVRFHPGVLLLELHPDSKLAAELAPGAIIVEVMEHPVEDVTELLQALEAYDLRNGVLITAVMPDGEVKKVRLRPE